VGARVHSPSGFLLVHSHGHRIVRHALDGSAFLPSVRETSEHVTFPSGLFDVIYCRSTVAAGPLQRGLQGSRQDWRWRWSPWAWGCRSVS